MVFIDDAYAMLLHEPYFKTFIKRPVADARQQTEGIFALSCGSRVEVDEMLRKALTTSTATTGKRSGWIRASSRKADANTSSGLR